MQFNILGGSYEQKYKASNSQRTINWYPITTTQTEQNKSQLSLFPTPGLTLDITLPGRYFRGTISAKTHGYTKAFAVIDNTLYEITSNHTYTTIGVLSSLEIGASRVTMLCNLQNEIGIFGYSASYVYNMSTGALTKITDQFFPGSVTSAAYVDQYAIVVSGGAVFESLTTSFLNWNGSQNYSTTFRAAPVLAVATLREQIYNFTAETIEVFVEDGVSPFSRLPRTTISSGIKAKDSLATYQNGFVYLGQSSNGQASVMFFDGYNPPQPLSDSSVSYKLNTNSAPLDDAYGYIQQTKDAQYWYFLTVSSINTTFCYSFNSNMWFERRSTKPFFNADGTKDQGIFRGAFLLSFNNSNLFLDAYSGKVFREDYSSNLEDTEIIRRVRRSQEFAQEDKNISFAKFVLDCNVGQGGLYVQFSWSDDGGYMFSEPVWLYLGDQADYLYRVMFHNLGTSRRRTYQLVFTDPGDLMLQSSYINGIVDSY